jgi:PAS domain-containing protein
MKRSSLRGLSDRQLSAVIESLPEGMALLDAAGGSVWANRLARRLLALRATTSPEDTIGTELGRLIGRFVEVMPPFRDEGHARWTVAGGDVVAVTLRRVWASQVAIRLSPPPEAAGAAADDATVRPTALQLILAERLLEESSVGLVVANTDGRIYWMNPQAKRLLDGAAKRCGRNAQRDVARAARHVAAGRIAPIRMRVELPTRVVEARFWNAAPGLAGVLFDDEDGEAASAFRGERLIA